MSSGRQWRLLYDRPALLWTEAMPLGNGKLGAMVFGGREDRIALNLASLWSGNGKEKTVSYGEIPWKKIREHILREEYGYAEKEIKKRVLADWTEAYLPAADLFLKIESTQEGFERQLNLWEAVYTEQSYGYRKEAFTDFVNNTLVIRLQSAQEKPLSLTISLTSPLPHEIAEDDEITGLTIKGRAPSYAAPNYYHCREPILYTQEAVKFKLVLKVTHKGGEVRKEGDRIRLINVKEAVLYLAGETNFSSGEKPYLLQDSSWERAVDDNLQAAMDLDYDSVKEAHTAYFCRFFDRFELELGEEDNSGRTDERLKRFTDGNPDPDFMALMFHYGRYLLISSSRPGGECANLQGIWNDKIRPPWSSNYTVNINTQMNYWMAEVCNLSELTQPLFDLMKRTALRGAKTAKELYGCKGWVSHHNIDIWGHSTPVGYYGEDENPCVYGMWNMSSGWLCRHLWEHYLYTGNNVFLEETAFPLMEGAVAFYLGYLQEVDGYLMTIPSTSPENFFLDKRKKVHAVTLGATMDTAIIRELFENYIAACERIGKGEYADRCKAVLGKLPPFKIGKYGQLQEWYRDYEEADVHHRHVSHLYGLYPAAMIRDEELKEACRVTLKRRGKDGTGWCIAWKAALWARLKDAEEMLSLLKNQLKYTDQQEIAVLGGGTYSNLFCAHPPFQIDGNFGFTAAVAEAILQSHEGKIQLLPALPAEWKKGRVKGIRARGGFTLAFEWEEKKVMSYRVEAAEPGEVMLAYNGREEVLTFTRRNQTISKEADEICLTNERNR